MSNTIIQQEVFLINKNFLLKHFHDIDIRIEKIILGGKNSIFQRPEKVQSQSLGKKIGPKFKENFYSVLPLINQMYRCPWH